MSPPHPHSYFSNLGLGYSIAIALAFLFLLSTLLLSSYLCCRARRNRTRAAAQAASRARSADGGVILPRVIFVAEDEDEEEESAAVGLEQSVINSYPRFEFSNREGARSNNTTCSICLCEYKDSEMLRMMPECRHFFHQCCLDSWLKLNGSCPVCRNSPLPTPLSTPLQEVVPLSQYAADRRRTR
ncbi:RING-H2 finger protein ATL67 [Cajanus cajan]|uniref:RING-H2 finger protein ATL3K n=1 Tax=Cajanus cajan TaxID=3821 RepID=A0A151RYI3_CAJCA|nr:RING-H2 finger protein ATL67 [Cajanus cajan]KYP47609.1 RING-H2 finger protein ATL3K [Cajanus cajan]